MAKVYTTEITSDQITSDNPIHQRLFKAYVVARDYVFGDVLEVGCGEGRGVGLLMEHAKSFTAVDKIEDAINDLKTKLLGYAAKNEPARLIDVPTFKTLAGVSRKYAIPLLEYFDREQVTRRAGDKRVILKPR